MKRSNRIDPDLTGEARIQEIERRAREGEVMPELLEQAEQYFFLSLRSLCFSTRSKLMPKEVAAGEYKRIRRAYEVAMIHDAGEREAMRHREKAIEALTQAVHQDGCPRCRAALNELLGLKR